MNEPRRSARLQESGYYQPDGTPVISYKERLFRFFKRRSYPPLQPRADFHEVTWRCTYVIGPLQPMQESAEPVHAPGPSEATQQVTEPEHVPVHQRPRRRSRSQRTSRSIRGHAGGHRARARPGPSEATQQVMEPEHVPVHQRPRRRTVSLVDMMLHSSQSSSSFFWDFFKFVLLSLFVVCGFLFVTQLQWDTQPRWILSNDKDTMPNFALQSLHAKIVRSHSSRTYHRGGFFEMIQSWWWSKHTFVLQPTSPLVPGCCWPFAGDRGHLHIELAEPVHITHFTLGHIKKSQSPTGQITSAPKYFFVYGMKTLDGEETFLGRFFYNMNGPSFQTFTVYQHRDEAFKHVRLEVDGNWGDTEYTCLYNFRVHGKLSHPVEAGGPT